MDEVWLFIANLAMMIILLVAVIFMFLFLVDQIARKIRMKFQFKNAKKKDGEIFKKVQVFRSELDQSVSDSAEIRDRQFSKYLDGLGGSGSSYHSGVDG